MWQHRENEELGNNSVEFLLFLEEEFSPMDALLNFDAKRSNLYQWFAVHHAHVTALSPMALLLSSSTFLTSLKQVFVPYCVLHSSTQSHRLDVAAALGIAAREN